MSTLQGGWLTTGQRTRDFERDFATYLQSTHAIAVNSCTAALHLALEAVGIGAGDAVVVPTMTFAATAEVVRYLGGTPILVDCEAKDFNLDVADAARRIEEAQRRGLVVKAIMPVHYGGQIADVAGYTALAKHHGLKIIEDAAHCCPAYYRMQSGERGEQKEADDASLAARRSPLDSGWLPVGRSADITCFSFYANKCITTGEGGMACTDNAEYADRMRIMSLHGISRDAWKRFTAEGSWYYEILAPGFKYNLTDIASAIGLEQLKKADRFHQSRTRLVGLYRAGLAEVEEIGLPELQPDRIHSWHLHVIRLKLDRLKIDRAQFITELQKLGVGTSVHWMPLHMHPYYRKTYGYQPEDLPVAAGLYPEIVSLPLYPDMTEEEVRYVCDSIKKVIGENLKR